MKCDDCMNEFPPGEVKLGFYGACFCYSCWKVNLPLDCFHCGKLKNKCACKPTEVAGGKVG